MKWIDASDVVLLLLGVAVLLGWVGASCLGGIC